MTENKTKVWFFAGGETRDDKFNVFTGSFVRLMKQIFGEEFDIIKGIYFRFPMVNVIWALNNAQKPVNSWITEKATQQIYNSINDPDTQLILVSSSSGSVVAAQTACFLAGMNKTSPFLNKPIHLVLGASLVSSHSELYRKLQELVDKGLIGIIIHDEIQDKGDNTTGAGGLTKGEAYRNAVGLLFPFFSSRFSGPSFLNKHPVKGHIHRRRSMTIRKSLDYIFIILVKYNLAGDNYRRKAEAVLDEQNYSF